MGDYCVVSPDESAPIIHVHIRGTDGLPLTGLAYNTLGMRVSVIRLGENTARTFLHDGVGTFDLETITTLGTWAAPHGQQGSL